jgi:hypothetical protein
VGATTLSDARARAALLEAVTGVDRLVLLGDVLELRRGPVADALTSAEPTLAELGRALAPGAQAILVAGNHDHRLLEPWLARRDRAHPLGAESAVDWRDGEPLARLVGWLGPREVRVAYPGVWLRDDVYATHGHYADRHTTVPMLERLGAAAMARIVGQDGGGPRRSEDYEAVLGPMYAWLDALAQNGVARPPGRSAAAWRALAGSGAKPLRRRAAAAAFPVVVAALNRTGLGPLSADLSGPSLRRGPLSAIGEVLARLEVDARHVIFGHTHRAGPLPGDDRWEWRAPSGAALVNCGCWVREATFADGWRGPYRAGFGVALDEDAAPRLLNLLDRG